MMEGVNLSKVCCKPLCEYHNESPIQLFYVNKNKFNKNNSNLILASCV
jgi:hypothetical protein